MSEQIQKLDTVKIDYDCDECEDGKMRPTGITLTSNPLQYPHACTVCGAEKTLLSRYPTIGWVPAGEEPTSENLIRVSQ